MSTTQFCHCQYCGYYKNTIGTLTSNAVELLTTIAAAGMVDSAIVVKNGDC